MRLRIAFVPDVHIDSQTGMGMLNKQYMPFWNKNGVRASLCGGDFAVQGHQLLSDKTAVRSCRYSLLIKRLAKNSLLILTTVSDEKAPDDALRDGRKLRVI